MDYSAPGSSVRGILQARLLEGVAVLSSRGSFRPRDRTCISYVSCIGRQVLYWEALHAEYIMQNAELSELQAGIKTAGRNDQQLRYTDDITSVAESEEELKSLLTRVKEKSEKAGLKLTIQKY